MFALSTPLRATLLSALASLLLVATLAPGSALAAREARTTGDFQAIVVTGGLDVHVRQGERTAVEVEGEAAAVARVETRVEAGAGGPVLHVRLRDGAEASGWRHPVAHVTTPRLVSVSMRGSGDLQMDAFQTPELALRLTGSGDARLEGLRTERLKVSIAGSGDVRGKGEAARLSLSIAGSGEASLREMKADDVEVSIAGSGHAEVHAEKKLDVRIAGSGDVRYAGAAEVQSRVAGSGSAKPLR